MRFNLRILLKNPGFATTAILTMALGIGVSTAVFSIAAAVLWRSLPFADPASLVVMNAIQRHGESDADPFSWPRFEFMRDHSRSYTGLGAFAEDDAIYTGPGAAERLVCARVSASFFDLLGVHPTLGTGFSAAEGKPGGPLTVIVSHQFFTRRLNADPAVIGRPIQLNGNDYIVDGVLPRAFQFLPLGRVVDAYIARPFEHSLLKQIQIDAGAGYLFALARLRPGVSRVQASAEMATLDNVYRHAKPGLVDADPSFSVKIAGLRDYMIANIRPATLVLIGAVAFVLLIACANVAGLLLARAMERRKEIAIRVALGAPAHAIVRQLLFESLVLAALGGFAGIALSFVATRILVNLTSATFAMVAGVHPDIPAALFAIGASLLCGVLFGLVPALQLAKSNNGSIESTLRAESGRGTGARERHLARNALIVSQVALSIVLLAGSTLLFRSFERLRNQKPGFDPDNLLTVSLNLTTSRYTGPAKQNAFTRQALDSITAIPGVSAVAISSALPVNPTRATPMLIEGQPQAPLRARPIVYYQMVTPDYSKTLRIPVVQGRMFTTRDDESAARVAMVNQAFVRRYWPQRNPVGASILLGLATRPTEVIGVLGDVKNDKLSADAVPEVLVPWFQNPWADVNITVRTNGPPAGYVRTVIGALDATDPGQPVTKIGAMSELFDDASREQRMLMVLAAIFSFCAFSIAIVGLYGVIAYSVAQRTRELGVRFALGAGTGDITRMVLRQAAILSGLGIAIGIAAALMLTRLMAARLYQISPADPVSYAASALVFAVVAMAGSLIPARRAARLNPVDALRE